MLAPISRPRLLTDPTRKQEETEMERQTLEVQQLEDRRRQFRLSSLKRIPESWNTVSQVTAKLVDASFER